MTVEVFPFDKFKFETVNPESGFRGQFGNSYTFSAEPNAPDQRVFKLFFTGMKFYFSLASISSTLNVTTNMKALIDFYQRHKLHKSFTFNHPVYGIVRVKFNKPLVEPKGISGGTGVVEDFEVELIEIP